MSLEQINILRDAIAPKEEKFKRMKDRLVSDYITSEDLNEYGFVKGDTEGFVNFPLSLEGVVFSVFFIEFDDGVKISFRSKYDFDVNKFARLHFNGGGHKNAAGGKVVDLNLKDTINYFISLLSKYKNELS